MVQYIALVCELTANALEQINAVIAVTMSRAMFYVGLHHVSLYTVSQKKLCQCYFLNNSIKHWPMLIIFGTQHHEDT